MNKNFIKMVKESGDYSTWGYNSWFVTYEDHKFYRVCLKARKVEKYEIHSAYDIHGYGYQMFTLDEDGLTEYRKEFKYFPYDEIREFSEDSRLMARFMMLYMDNPQIEFIVKTPQLRYLLGSLTGYRAREELVKCFKKGKNISECTGMPNWLWKLLAQNAVDIIKWNEIRIWNNKLTKKNAKDGKKSKGLTEGDVQAIINLNLDYKSLNLVRKVIDSLEDYTVSKMLRYLERVDMYQAIPAEQAILLLSDYVKMCKDLRVTPRLDSDSLKREHDVTARNHRIYKRQLMAEKRSEEEKQNAIDFVKRGKELDKYAYESDELIVKVPHEVKDLIDEGFNNHNCVGSYVSRFANGKSNIFFIRKKDNPEKSYITIELNPSCTESRQAFYASNMPITSRRDQSFIKDWLEHNVIVNEKTC